MPNTLFLSTILYYLIKKLWWNIIWPRKYIESEGFYLIPNFGVHSYLTISETKYPRAEQERMFSHLVSDSLHLHGLQHARLPCPSPSPGVWSDSCPLSQWCHSTISSSATPFSGLQSFPASGSLPVSRLFTLDGQSFETSSSVSVLQMNIWGLFPLGLTGLISFKPKGLSGVFPTITIWKPQFFSSQPSLWFNSHIHTWLLEKQTFDYILTICTPPHSPAKKQTKQNCWVCVLILHVIGIFSILNHTCSSCPDSRLHHFSWRSGAPTRHSLPQYYSFGISSCSGYISPFYSFLPDTKSKYSSLAPYTCSAMYVWEN